MLFPVYNITQLKKKVTEKVAAQQLGCSKHHTLAGGGGGKAVTTFPEFAVKVENVNLHPLFHHFDWSYSREPK